MAGVSLGFARDDMIFTNPMIAVVSDNGAVRMCSENVKIDARYLL